MGCSTSNVQEFQNPQPHPNPFMTLTQQGPSSTQKGNYKGNSSLSNGQTTSTLKETQSRFNYQEEEYVYTLKSFHPIEKISENTIYKQFRVINNHTNSVQMMYVIPLTYSIKHKTLSSLKQLKEKNLVNINYVFSDDNFKYIITDLAMVNIFDAVYQYSSFTVDKIKKILRGILTGINYIYEQNETILKLDYSKIKVLNESLEVKLEYFDIKYLIYSEEETNPIENVLYEIGKVVLLLLTSKRVIPFTSYKDMNIEEVYSSDELIEEYPIELIEVLEVLLSGQEKNISKILSLDYFTSQIHPNPNPNPNSNTKANNSNSNPNTTNPLDRYIKDNNAFFSFYSKYFLYRSTKKFLKCYSQCKDNNDLYESLLENIKSQSDTIEISNNIITDNLRSKMPNRYTQFEMTEIVSLLSKVHLSKFSQKQIVMMLAEYDCSLLKAQVKKAFDLFDENDTGRIEVEKLKEIFDLYGNNNNNNDDDEGDADNDKDEIGDIINEVDKADDHMISFNEFLYVLIKIN